MVRGESRQSDTGKRPNRSATRLMSYCYTFHRTNSALPASLPSGRSDLPGLLFMLVSLEPGSPCQCSANTP
jgi:hypothetical protein